MKAKHIISAVLVVILPFILIFVFGTLSTYLIQMTGRTFMPHYRVFGVLVSAVPLVAYIFWLSFTMRPKNHKARILLGYCSLTIAVFLLFSSLSFWAGLLYYSINFASETTLICGLANLFAAIYMLSRGKKYDEV